MDHGVADLKHTLVSRYTDTVSGKKYETLCFIFNSVTSIFEAHNKNA
jgi:hypothetical protein